MIYTFTTFVFFLQFSHDFFSLQKKHFRNSTKERNTQEEQTRKDDDDDEKK